MPGCWVIYILDNEHLLADFSFCQGGSHEKTLPSMSSKQWNEALVILDFFTVLSRNYEWLYVDLWASPAPMVDVKATRSLALFLPDV